MRFSGKKKLGHYGSHWYTLKRVPQTGISRVNYGNQRTLQRISILAHFLISAPIFIQRQSALAHVFAVAEGRKTCFRVRKAFLRGKIAFSEKKARFSAKKRVFRAEKRDFRYLAHFRFDQRTRLLAHFINQRIFKLAPKCARRCAK